MCHPSWAETQNRQVANFTTYIQLQYIYLQLAITCIAHVMFSFYFQTETFITAEDAHVQRKIKSNVTMSLLVQGETIIFAYNSSKK